MKRQNTKRSIGLLVALGLSAMIGTFATPARADYTGNCAGLSGSVSGNVTINDTSCTISNDVTATGNISITASSINGKSLTSQTGFVNLTANSGAINLTGTVNSYLNTILKGTAVTSGIITSDYGVQVEATNGALTLSDVTSNNGDGSFGGNIMLTATKNIKVGNVKNNGSTTTAGIEIRANTAGGATQFTIGGTGANSSGNLSVQSTTGGGTDPYYMPNGIYVSSGPAAGIKVTAMSNLVVSSSASRSGILVLDAPGGTITLPTGSLSADGTSTQGAGRIVLNATTVTTVNGTIISASQTTSGYFHGVDIAASTLNLAGASGLQVKADGNGVSSAPGTTFIGMFPKGGLSFNFTGGINNRNLQVNYVNFFQKSGNLTVAGANSPLTVSANGDYSVLNISAYPINFNNKTVTIQARGTVSHLVQIGYSGSYSGVTGLQFTGTGNVAIDANATTGTGGDVSIFSDKFTFNSPTITLSANGPTSGNGNGGTVYFSSSALTLSSSSTLTVTANASSVGTGNAVLGDVTMNVPKAIQFYPGSVGLNIGTATGVGQVSFSAKGGSAGGNGGTILVSSSPVNIKTANALNASALAGNGNGGEIYFYSYVSSLDPSSTILAQGFGNGTGGKFTAYYANGTDTLNINNIIKVGGGTTLSAGGLDGRMKLNNITCQQYRIGASWPNAYWNCANPDSQTTRETSLKDGVTVLPPTFKTSLSGTNIYIFTKAADYNTFFAPMTTVGIEARGYSISSKKLAMVFEQKGSAGDDITLFLKGALNHEMGHLVNAFNGNPQGTAGFISAYTADMNNMKGNYPTLPQSPTCMQVFNEMNFCNNRSADGNPWITLSAVYIGTQPVDSEMFAFAFQTCSGFTVYDLPLNNAEFTNRYNISPPNLGYMANVNTWMNGYWPGGCP